MKDDNLLATIDVGSNRCRLEIWRLADGRIQHLDTLEETLCHGSGLDAHGRLTAEAMARGWAGLARCAERLAGFAAHQVRAVATLTLREAGNREHFLLRARTVLGYPIRVVADELPVATGAGCCRPASARDVLEQAQ